jgi:hypothetical protein
VETTIKPNLQNLIDFFSITVPKSLGLQYSEVNKNIVKMIIETEAKDNTFLPGNLPVRVRAELAVPIFKFNNLVLNQETEKKINKYRNMATLIILNHRKTFHKKDDLTLDKETKQIDDEFKKNEMVFTEEEQQIINSSTTASFWRP